MAVIRPRNSNNSTANLLDIWKSSRCRRCGRKKPSTIL